MRSGFLGTVCRQRFAYTASSGLAGVVGHKIGRDRLLDVVDRTANHLPLRSS
jgi:hypothetical protein